MKITFVSVSAELSQIRSILPAANPGLPVALTGRTILASGWILAFSPCTSSLRVSEASLSPSLTFAFVSTVGTAFSSTS